MAAVRDLRIGRERRLKNAALLELAASDDDRERVVEWAMATIAEAEERLLTLQVRIAQLEEMSVTDELTEVLNRRGFISQLDRGLAAVRRGAPPGVLAICDLDGFKAVNDRYGHKAGNDALRDFAALVGSRIRRNDTLGRLGGDEFGLILAGATLAGARRKTAFLTELVASTVFHSDGVDFQLGVSFGLAPFTGRESEEELMHRADLAMYAEKRRHGEACSA